MAPTGTAIRHSALAYVLAYSDVDQISSIFAWPSMTVVIYGVLVAERIWCSTPEELNITHQSN
jgi:hypothetical protein